MTITIRRNVALCYVAVAAFLIFAIVRIRQTREYAPETKDTVVDTTGSSWSLGLWGDREDQPSRGGKKLDQTKNKQAHAFKQKQPPDDVTGDHDESKEATKKGGKPSFYEIAYEKGSDKVRLHTYADMYERHLSPKRTQKVKLLEIGIGCGLEYGAGGSYHVWTKYFSNLDLFFIEDDPECASKRAGEFHGATIMTGNPGDENFLERFVETHGRDFDFITITGGYTVGQQMVSLQRLWKAVKPGGGFFCEYLETSYLEQYGGESLAKSSGKMTMVRYLHRIMDDMMFSDPNLDAYYHKGMGPSWERQVRFTDVESISHMDCGKQICAVFKVVKK